MNRHFELMIYLIVIEVILEVDSGLVVTTREFPSAEVELI